MSGDPIAALFFSTPASRSSFETDYSLVMRYASGRSLRGVSILLVCLSLACVVPEPPPARVIVIGLDGADWQFLDPLLSAGHMPHLKSLIDKGSSGILQSLNPPLSPLIWTTMMTGTSPLEHRVLDFTRFHPDDGTREPITSSERQVPALWTMTALEQRSAGVFGMWATYPAESIRGVVVSDRLYSFQHHGEAPVAGVASPTEWQTRSLQMRREVESTVQLTSWLPHEPVGSEQSIELARALVQTELYHRLAIERLRQSPDDLTIVYFQGTDVVGHLFAPYVAPKLPQISQQEFERYGALPARYHEWIDQLLGEYIDQAQQIGARLLIVSDHGFHWADRRPIETASASAATAGLWHREHGIWLMAGPGIKATPRERTPVPVDRVANTVLALLDLPSAQGAAMPPFGPVVASERSRDYRAGYLPIAETAESVDAGAALDQLRGLGYVGASEPEQSPKPGSTRTAASHNNEGLLRRQQGELELAIAAFRAALTLDPQLASAAWNLSDVLDQDDRDPRESDALLLRACAAGLHDGIARLFERISRRLTRGQLEPARALASGGIELQPQLAALRIYRARIASQLGDCRGALHDAERGASLDPQSAPAHALVGVSALCLGEMARARRAFERSLALDPAQPQIAQALSRLGI